MTPFLFPAGRKNMEKPCASADKGGEEDAQRLLKVIKKLPVGFRFLPTDEELLVHYLRKRTSRWPSLASTFIPELDVFRTDPLTLPGDQREKRYFFCRKFSTRPNGSHLRISTNSGRWKTLSKMKQISAIYGSLRVAGVRRTLAFRSNNLSDGNDDASPEPRWMLHEISLTGDNESGSEDRDWAVYRLFQKKKTSLRKRDVGIPRATLNSTCSSSISTEISRRGSSDQEESSFSS